MTTGEHMRKARELAGMSREKLRDLSGIRVMTIYNVETGRCLPYLHTAIKLADALGIPLDEYIGRRVPK